jgi:hypothetical protein
MPSHGFERIRQEKRGRKLESKAQVGEQIVQLRAGARTKTKFLFSNDKIGLNYSWTIPSTTQGFMGMISFPKPFFASEKTLAFGYCVQTHEFMRSDEETNPIPLRNPIEPEVGGNNLCDLRELVECGHLKHTAKQAAWVLVMTQRDTEINIVIWSENRENTNT